MIKPRKPACLLCGAAYEAGVRLSPREIATLSTADGLQVYCPACGPRHHATWEEKRCMRRLSSQAVYPSRSYDPIPGMPGTRTRRD